MGIEDFRIMNAAGWCKDVAEVRSLSTIPVITDITIGSVTYEPRALNTAPDGSACTTFWSDEDIALNSLGLNNGGSDYFNKHLPAMHRIAHRAGKRLRRSIAGFSPEEYGTVASFGGGYVDEDELNVGCPNVWGDEGQKPIASFEPDLLHAIMCAYEQAVPQKPYAVKLSPYSNPMEIPRIAQVLNAHAQCSTVVLCNTFPNGFAFGDDATPAIGVGKGLGGLSGPVMLPIALGHIVQFQEHLHKKHIIGVGGITYGEDAVDYARLGIAGVQVGTQYFQTSNRPVIFQEIAEALVASDVWR